jgi:NAD(P)-dependent dehydrogenase (short-subunit alcohol dehydrogenase family)
MTDRVALVTGAGQGVGLGIATVLANEGVTVAVNDLHPERAEAVARSIVDAGGKAVGVAFDVTDRPGVEGGITAVTDQLGPIDILVNNAGIAEHMATGPFLQSDPTTWRPTFDLNLFGSMECIHAVAPVMVERGWGRIVQISSGASSTGLSIGVSLYGAAKAGIEGLFRHLAVELGPTGVTCNVLALGLMENGVRTDPPERVAALTRSIPVRRLGRATEIGAAVCWLASDSAAYVTGQVIHVNGGALNGR